MIRSNHHPVGILIFDVDGVLLNSKGHQITALELLKSPRVKWNKDTLKKDNIRSMDILRLFEAADSELNFQSWKKLNRLFKKYIPHTWERWKFFYKMVMRVRKYEDKLSSFYPGTFESLHKLHQQGYLFGICSNAEGIRTQKWLKRTKLDSIIECSVSRDQRKIYGLKPNPRPLLGLLLMIKRKYGLTKINRNRVAFIGDNRTDILAAKNAQIKSVFVLSGHGYRSELLDLHPDLILNTVADLPQYINKLFK